MKQTYLLQSTLSKKKPKAKNLRFLSFLLFTIFYLVAISSSGMDSFLIFNNVISRSLLFSATR